MPQPLSFILIKAYPLFSTIVILSVEGVFVFSNDIEITPFRSVNLIALLISLTALERPLIYQH